MDPLQGQAACTQWKLVGPRVGVRSLPPWALPGTPRGQQPPSPSLDGEGRSCTGGDGQGAAQLLGVTWFLLVTSCWRPVLPCLQVQDRQQARPGIRSCELQSLSQL